MPIPSSLLTGRPRSSAFITLLWSGALATSMGLSGCGSSDPEPPTPAPTTVPLNPDQLKDDQDQENNSYVQGVGYYHSPSRGWFPYPYDWYFPSRGYYRNGDWYDRPSIGPVPNRSRPSTDALRSIREGMRSGSVLPRFGFSERSGGMKSGITRGLFSAPHPGLHFGGS